VAGDDFGEIEADTGFDETYDPQAQAELAEAEKEADLKAERRRLFIVAVLNDPEGRDWLWGILDRAHTFEVPGAVTPTGFPDPQAAWAMLGMHNIGWGLWCELDDASPDLASLMRREHR
jgi:hypothetical protein